LEVRGASSEQTTRERERAGHDTWTSAANLGTLRPAARQLFSCFVSARIASSVSGRSAGDF